MKTVLLLVLLSISCLFVSAGPCTDPYEANNGSTKATIFFSRPLGESSSSKSISAYLTKGDQDWYRVNLDFTGKLSILLSGLPSNYDVELYGAAGLSSWLKGAYKSGTSNESIEYTFTTQQSTYVFIKVYPSTNNNFSDCKPYSLTVSWTPINTCTLTGTKPSNQSPGSVSSSGPNINTLTPVLTVSKVNGATKYGFYIRDMSNNSLVLDNACASSNEKYQVPAGMLKPGTTYRWNAKSSVDCDKCVSGFSEPFYFTTPSVSCQIPSKQVENIRFENHGTNQFTVKWDAGNGSKRVIKINTSNSFTAPSNGSDPTASTSYNGNGEKVIYNGSGNSVTVTGLNPSTTYWVKGYEYQCSGSNTVYSTASGANNPKSTQTTANCGAPSITSHPSAQSVLIGGQVQFQVQATGNSLSYQWEVDEGSGSYKAVTGGSNYSGAHTSILSVLSIPANFDKFKFVCIISNGCSTIRSNPAALTVQNQCMQPSITTQPISHSVALGGNVSFVTEVSGTGIQHRWQIKLNNSWSNLSNSSIYSGVTSATLELKGVTSDLNHAIYRDSVTNSCGKQLSAEAKLTVTANCTVPLVVTQPISQMVKASDKVVYTATVTGTAAIFQWQELVSGNWINLVNGANYSGVATAMLTIQSAPIGFNGKKFRLSVTNACGSVFSAIVTLGIEATPSFAIRGTVKDVKLLIQQKTLEESDLGNCSVIAYLPGTSTQAATTQTNASGDYTLLLHSSGKYDIVGYSNVNPGLKVKMEKISTGTSNADIVVPFTLMQQLEQQLSRLTRLKPTISSLASTSISTFGYNISPQSSLLNTWQSTIHTNHALKENMGRLLLADSVLRMYYGNADRLNNEMAEETFQFFRMITEFFVITTKLQKMVKNNTTWLDKTKAHLVDDALAVLNSAIDDLIDKMNIAIPHTSSQMKLLIRSKIDQLRYRTIPSGETIVVALEAAIKEIFTHATIGTFIQRTQAELDASTQKAKLLGYTGDFTVKYKEVTNKALADWTTALQATIAAEEHREKSGIANAAAEAYNLIGSIAAVGSFVQAAQIFKAASGIARVWAYAELFKAMKISMNAFDANIQLVKPTISLNEGGNQTALPAVRLASLQSVELAVAKFNHTLGQLKDKMRSPNGEIDTIIQSAMASSHYKLKSELDQAMIPVYTTMSTMSGLPEYDSILVNTFKATLELQPKYNLSLQFAYLASIFDPTSRDLKDHVSKLSDSLILINNLLKEEFRQIYISIFGMPSLNYLQNVSSTIPSVMEQGTLQSCEIKVKNTGPAATSNLRAVLFFDSKFAIETDTIALGVLQDGEIKRFQFNIKAPFVAADSVTVLPYHIVFNDERLVAEGIHGAIRIRPRPSAPIVSYNRNLCVGDTLRLYAAGASDQAVYQWRGPNNFSSTLANPIIPGVGDKDFGNYTCEIQEDGLKSDQVTLPISIVMPIVAVSGNLAFCKGGHTLLTASGADTYQWSDGTRTPVKQVTEPGIYTVTGTNTIGCSDKKSVTILQHELPEVEAGKAVHILQSEKVSLGGAPTAKGRNPFTYQWSPAGDFADATIANPVIAPLMTKSYTLVVKDVNGCMVMDSVQVTVSGLKVFPNPVRSGQAVSIVGSNLPDGNFDVQLLDAAGKIVQTETVTSEKSIINTRFYLPQLNPSVMSIRIKGKDYNITIRLVVL